MASFSKFDAFVEALAEGIHNLGSNTLMVALTNSAPSAANSVLADITQISYTNLSSRTLSVASSSQTGGTYKLVLNDLVLTSSGGSTGPFRYIVLYNDTAASKNLIGYYDYGSSLTLNSGESLTIDFDPTTGVLTIV